jgi:signal transduction histidine kinase
MTSPVHPPSPRRVLINLLRSPFAPRTLTDTAFVGTGLAVGVTTCCVVVTLAATALLLAPTTILALPVLAVLFWCEEQFTAVQLTRIHALTGTDIQTALPAERGETGVSWTRRLWARTKSAGTWRRLAYHALSGIVDTIGFCIVFGLWSIGIALATVALWVWALPPYGGLLGYSVHGAGRLVALTLAGVVAFFAAPTAARLTTRAQVAMAAAMLSVSRSERLARRVDSLSRSRTEVIDAADAERRRIERDLHDGAQQRLVSLAMGLGMTRTMLADVPEPVRDAIEQAHEEAKQALTELRDFVRGLHPAVLDDLGLDAALSGVAARSPVPVRLLVDLPRRPPRAVETVAYFVVSEALANTAKHAHATQVDVVAEQVGASLRIIVSDNGRGGADESRGSGLRGLGQRVRALDGAMSVDSPPGGPTLLVVELPCGS